MMDLGSWARSLVERYGDRPAVIGENDALTFAQLHRIAEGWAAALSAHGIGPGSRVGLLAGNGPQWLTIAFGTWRAGATLVPISTFVTARELQETLDHAEVDLLIFESRLRSHDYRAALQAVRATLPRLRTAVVLDDAAQQNETATTDFLSRSSGVSTDPINPETIACILYTSGTTGRPKGVMLSHRAILGTVIPTAARTGLRPTDVLLSSLPLFWVAGLVIRALPTLETGCALLLVRSFTPDAVIELLGRHRPTGIHLRPAQIGQILAHPRFDPATCARLRRGGGRVEWYSPPLELSDARFITGYGMTEMAGYVSAQVWNDARDGEASNMGRPLPGVEIRIAVSEPSAGTGEICVRGPGLFSGYYREPPHTGLDSDGYFMTGDLGSIDDTGHLHFAGRSKDLLRVKGINVSPVEVESVLRRHAGIENVYVVGLPLDGLEQEIVAVLVAKPSATVHESEVRDLAGEMLSHYKRPHHYLFVRRDEIPLGGTAKPQRRALAELATRRVIRG